MVRAMADGRKRSAAKQARRDARRRKAQRRETAETEAREEAPLIDEVREALDGGQPLDLLGLVSMVIEATAPQAVLFQRPEDEEALSLGDLVAAFIDVRLPETTALLAVLGELVVGDDVLRDRCRREVESRGDDLPAWLASLADTTVTRTVRMTHVLGDGDELLLGVRFANGQEITGAVFVDHLSMSEVKDAFFVPDAIDGVLAIATASNTDPDTTFVDLDVAEARYRLLTALEQPSVILTEESETWPSSRALVRWLARLLPEDGSYVDVPQGNAVRDSETVDSFFASVVGAPFDDVDHRALLDACIEEGTGDPLRWSAARLTLLLDGPFADDEIVPMETQLDAPELLRAYVPFAHARGGISEELTAEALAAIDEAADDYRAAVVEEAREDDDFDPSGSGG
ncbi:MAG: hypothetical protein QOJ95_206 [Mycobacterium sp.]|jgi:hypothetical protein|nr:hypothetical protein [Mycobacterium sp.]